MKLGKTYDKTYKAAILVPLLVLLVCIIYLGYFIEQNGDIIKKDVSLTGGTTISVFDPGIDNDDLVNSLIGDYPDLRVRSISDFSTNEKQGIILETKADVTDIKPSLEEYLGYELVQENSSIEFSGSLLSEGFYKQLRIAIGIAFLFMAIVVFLIFRTFIPSLAVVLSAFSDIVMTLAVVNFFGMELSIAGIIAFLMLIGYSVDTDILLTTRVLKNKDKGSINRRLMGALNTGATMTITSIAAVSIALIMIWGLSDVLRQIFLIILIGLGFDLFNTWFANAGILKWYAEREERK